MSTILKGLARRTLPASLTGLLRGRIEGLRFLAGEGEMRRWYVLGRYQRVADGVRCEHGEPEALLVAREIAALPADVAGDIAECGCFLGGSTAKLSVLAKEMGRRLVVFDSFEGLPGENGSDEVAYGNLETGGSTLFRRGDYAGALEQVRATVDALGEGSVVEYVPGFFADTLPHFHRPVAAVLIDVDLVESTRDAIRPLWPLLSPGGVMFSQDGHLREVCDLLRDPEFWAELGEPRPPHWEGLGTRKMIFARKPRPA